MELHQTSLSFSVWSLIQHILSLSAIMGPSNIDRLFLLSLLVTLVLFATAAHAGPSRYAGRRGHLRRQDRYGKDAPPAHKDEHGSTPPKTTQPPHPAQSPHKGESDSFTVVSTTIKGLERHTVVTTTDEKHHTTVVPVWFVKPGEGVLNVPVGQWPSRLPPPPVSLESS
jgi:hypothetical protein